MPHISIVQKFAYQLTYTAVPIRWNSSTNRLVLQYQLMMYQVGTAMHWLGSDKRLSYPWQYFVKGKAIFCQIFLPLFFVMLVYFDVKMVQMHQKANNPLIQGFQLEKIFFPVRNIFFPTGRFFPSNWAFFVYLVIVCRFMPCESVKIFYLKFICQKRVTSWTEQMPTAKSSENTFRSNGVCLMPCFSFLSIPRVWKPAAICLRQRVFADTSLWCTHQCYYLLTADS